MKPANRTFEHAAVSVVSLTIVIFSMNYDRKSCFNRLIGQRKKRLGYEHITDAARVVNSGSLSRFQWFHSMLSVSQRHTPIKHGLISAGHTKGALTMCGYTSIHTGSNRNPSRFHGFQSTLSVFHRHAAMIFDLISAGHAKGALTMCGYTSIHTGSNRNPSRFHGFQSTLSVSHRHAAMIFDLISAGHTKGALNMINRFYLKAACGTPTGMLAQRGIMGNIGPPRAQPSSLR